MRKLAEIPDGGRSADAQAPSLVSELNKRFSLALLREGLLHRTA